MNNNLNFQFGMYDPATDSIIVNSGENSVLVIRCKECNSSVIFEEPNDIVYLCRLAEESPLTYVQGYINKHLHLYANLTMFPRYQLLL